MKHVAYHWLVAVALMALAAPAFAAPAVSESDCVTLLTWKIDAARHPLLRRAEFSRLREPVSRFYRSRNYRPAWFEAGLPTTRADLIADTLYRADEKGLDPIDYDGDQWPSRLQARAERPRDGRPCADRSLDLALTVSVMRYLSDIRVGRVDPRHLQLDLDVSAKRHDPADVLNAYLQAGDASAFLAAMEPPFRRYRALLEALARYRQLAMDPMLDRRLEHSARALRPGEPFPQLDLLAYKLTNLGDLPADLPDVELAQGIYGGALVGAVERFQWRHGLERDGIIGRKTLAQLNVTMAERVRQIRLSLERWRWLPDRLGHRPLVINVPEYKLYAFEADEAEGYRAAIEMDVIVGQSFPKHQTPVFRAAMSYIVFSPYWNVPHTILKRELYPLIERNPDYLAENNYQIVAAFRTDAEPFSPDPDRLADLRGGRLKLRQTPGAHNALGSAKFMFPNEHGVYLHGTPAIGLFDKDKRDFSHGCIRVADPPALAKHVLRQEKGWDGERVDELIASGETRQVNLSDWLDVYVIYVTATVEPDGTVRFLEDIYGHDDRLAQALKTGDDPAI